MKPLKSHSFIPQYRKQLSESPSDEPDIGYIVTK